MISDVDLSAVKRFSEKYIEGNYIYKELILNYSSVLNVEFYYSFVRLSWSTDVKISKIMSLKKVSNKEVVHN